MAFLKLLKQHYQKLEKAILHDQYDARGKVLTSYSSHDQSASNTDFILEIEDICLNIGGLRVLDQVSLRVRSGSIHAIIGPNGAGKTSLLNCISQVYRYGSGSIRLDGEVIDGLRPDQAAARGIARTFQHTELFSHMSVLDILMLGRTFFMRGGMLHGGLWLPGAVKEQIINRQKVEEVIEFLHLEQFRDLPVGQLPYGVQKRVDLGRALAMNPKILLLDEPCAGMNQEETEDMARFILDVQDEMDLCVVIIEHNMRVIMDISDQVTVLNFGIVIADGDVAAVQKSQAVAEAYLGTMENSACMN